MKKISIDLYFVSLDTSERFLKPHTCFISNKTLYYQEIEYEGENNMPFLLFEENVLFEFELDNTYANSFKKFKPNARFKLYNDNYEKDKYLAGMEMHAKLSFVNKWRLLWLFKKTWIQKPKIFIALLAIVLGMLSPDKLLLFGNYLIVISRFFKSCFSVLYTNVILL